MASLREWEAYPINYRATEMAEVARWLRHNESGVVVGLPGIGKSNLLGFLCHQPQALAQHWGDWRGKFLVALVDLNNLPNYEFATVYRGILRSLYEERARWYAIDSHLPTLLEEQYRHVVDRTEPFAVQSALREVLLWLQRQDIHLTLIYDPFDRFIQHAPTHAQDSLRGLRDSFKSHLSYVVGLRQEITYDSNTEVVGELYELLDSHTLWIQPMEYEDARWVIKQVQAMVNLPFSEKWAAQLIGLTGGYPSLLKAASLWLSEQSTLPDPDAWGALLLTETSIQNRLWDIWYGLSDDEQSILSISHTYQNLTNRAEADHKLHQLARDQAHILAALCRKGILSQDWQCFSPLFVDFLTQIKGVAGGRIWRHLQTDSFFRGEDELEILSEQDRRLLRHFLKHPKVIHTIDDLIAAVWDDYDSCGVSIAAVQQAICHLRKQIELDPSNPHYLITQYRVGYRFFPDGKP